MKKNEIKKLKFALLLTFLLASNPQKIYANNVDDLEFNVETIGEPIFADELCDILRNFPSGIKEYLRLNNLNIVLLEDPYGAEYYWEASGDTLLGSIRGFTDTDNQVIYIESSMHPGYYENYYNISNEYTEEEFNYILTKDTLIHELGHFFDTASGFNLSQSEYFYQIFNEEIVSYYNTTEFQVGNLGVYENISIPAEYFASSFSCYLNYPDSLRENCPLTYDYIDSYMKNLNKEYAPDEEYDIKKITNNQTDKYAKLKNHKIGKGIDSYLEKVNNGINKIFYKI